MEYNSKIINEDIFEGNYFGSGDLILSGKIEIDGDGGVPDATIEVSGDVLRLKDKGSINAIIDSDDSAGSGDFRVRAHSGEVTRFIVSSSGNVNKTIINKGIFTSWHIKNSIFTKFFKVITNLSNIQT